MSDVATMYELDAYRYDCPTAQRMIWDTTIEALRERSPETFTGEYAYKITRLEKVLDGYGRTAVEIVEQSADYVSWRDYEPTSKCVACGGGLKSEHEIDLELCAECDTPENREQFFGVVYVGRCRECERRLTSEEFFYGHDCEV